MIRQIENFLAKIERDRIAGNGRAALLAYDGTLVGRGPEDLVQLGRQVLDRLDIFTLALVQPALPFADILIADAPADTDRLVPRDTETRTFLHDIPFVRQSELGYAPARQLADLLGHRKGILVEGIGIIASGSVTPEQAYINASSIFHAVFVKYLLDLLYKPSLSDEDRSALKILRGRWLKLPDKTLPPLLPGEALCDRRVICEEISRVGRLTVEYGLVDSFFGNISCRHDATIYISQTGAALDELQGCIDPIPADNSSTCGITASSELPAHRLVYDRTDARTLLHGHPKFSVIMSMLCEESACSVTDCWRDCPHVRQVGDIPIVSGEVGAGGLADRVAPVIGKRGSVLVYGHGVFALGYDGFRDALDALLATEEWCRNEYFGRLHAKVD